MIIRVIAVDPNPRRGESDLVVYQVPENSAAHRLLTHLLDSAGIEWTQLDAPATSRKRKGS